MGTKNMLKMSRTANNFGTGGENIPVLDFQIHIAQIRRVAKGLEGRARVKASTCDSVQNPQVVTVGDLQLGSRQSGDSGNVKNGLPGCERGGDNVRWVHGYVWESGKYMHIWAGVNLCASLDTIRLTNTIQPFTSHELGRKVSRAHDK